jgi:cytochrome c oxidase subunit 2
MMAAFAGQLRWFLMIVCLVIFVFSFGMMLALAYAQHRKGSKDTSNFHDSVVVEICWALAPLFIVMQIVWSTAESIFSP